MNNSHDPKDPKGKPENDIDFDPELSDDNDPLDIVEDSDPDSIDARRALRKTALERAHRLAIGMAIEDRHSLLIWLLVIALPELLVTFTETLSPPMVVGAYLLRESFSLYFMYRIANKWTAYFKEGDFKVRAPDFHSKLRPFAMLTMFLWLPLMLPSIFAGYTNSEEWRLLAGAIYIAGLLIYFQFYFYFVPLLMGARNPNEVFQGATAIFRQYKLLPVLAAGVPRILLIIPVAVATALSPDQRYLSVTGIILALEVLCWIVQVYLSIGYGLVFCPDNLWRHYEMDRYRQARFSTVTVLAPEPAFHLLRGKNLFKVFLLGLLINTANYMQLLQLAPAPEINPVGLSINDSELTVNLSVSDPEFRYRGFQPRWLIIAGTNRSMDILAEPFPEVTVDGNPFERNNLTYLKGKAVELSLTFKTSRKGEDLAKLEDLYLWYNGFRLFHLDMSKAQVSLKKAESEARTETDQRPEEAAR